MTPTNKTEPVRVLIVEDHPIVSDSLFRLVNEAFENIVCIHAATGAKGMSYLNGNHFDIILLDINLPDISGIDFCKTAKARYPELKILAVTSLTQRHVVEHAMQAGMDGFVLKTSDVKDIKEGIQQVIAGKKYYGKGVKELLSVRATGGEGDPLVTRRESEILRLIADGFTNQAIAEKLFISTSTVDSHRKNLLLKFNAKNTAELVKIAISKAII